MCESGKGPECSIVAENLEKSLSFRIPFSMPRKFMEFRKFIECLEKSQVSLSLYFVAELLIVSFTSLSTLLLLHRHL